jgi:cytoplasmic iron level regulating protein YaaA (DUF328/UPF0246 family)
VLRRATEPLFVQQATALITTLRQHSPSQVAALMDLSDALANLNVQRYAHWQPVATPANSKPAVLAFNGDVYDGLDAKTLRTADLDWAQQHLVLLSGLYGALRPLDWLQPYRLEMGTALKTTRGKDLYAFWADTVVQHLNERQAEEGKPVIVNLASQEYARVVLGPQAGKALRAQVVECVFEEGQADGSYKVVSFFAKKARGLMARYAVQHRLRSAQSLRGFDAAGYAWQGAASTPQRLVFRRKAGAEPGPETRK